MFCAVANDGDRRNFARLRLPARDPVLSSSRTSDDFMQRGPLLLSHVALRVLTIAITLVVGLKVGPQLAARGASIPGIGSPDQKVLDDTARAGQRIEPRVSPAHFIDRVLPACPSYRAGAVAHIGDALALGAEASAGRSQGQRLPIVKHVPRMERGDPPRA